MLGKTLLALSALVFVGSSNADDLHSWLANQNGHSYHRLIANISPHGTHSGVVIASPSKTPDYFYHWVRDAALVMDVLVEKYIRAENGSAEQVRLEKLLIDYICFSRYNQVVDTPSGGPGEPKYHVDGKAYTGDWARPQNDGPALRAITLSKLALFWIHTGKESLVRQYLYWSPLPATSVVKVDLEFVSHHWRETCFDLWEETRAHHFYTRMVQRKALILGVILAEKMSDHGAAAWYREQAELLSKEIPKHWDDGKKIYLTMLNRDGGLDYKHSGIDSSVILALLHGDMGDGFIRVSDDKMLSTVAVQKAKFKEIYAINHNGTAGVGIGRYPEDRYDGIGTSGEGNPWVLLTAGFAEYYFKVANELESKGVIVVNDLNRAFFEDMGIFEASPRSFNYNISRIREEAYKFLERVRYHNPDGRFREQMNRYTGYQQGAEDLTWSYASFLTALAAR